MNRYYFRCPVCLSVQAVELEKSMVCHCELCAVKMKEMGHVYDNHLVQDEMRSVCDARCTNASGPSCDCKCNGKNHGSGLIVMVKVIVGEIPKIPITDATAYFRKKEYLKADAEARQRLEERIAEIKSQTNVNQQHKIYQLKNLYEHATNMEQHRMRIKALKSLFIPKGVVNVINN